MKASVLNKRLQMWYRVMEQSLEEENQEGYELALNQARIVEKALNNLEEQ